uniref:Uncharacterized protein n=1 Tax=Megaselia scalaris TaxID=36166 RepID=T1GCK1_MEGSC
MNTLHDHPALKTFSSNPDFNLQSPNDITSQ